MPERPRIAILASGGGTTAEAYIRAAHADKAIPKVSLVISNNHDAGVFARIAQLDKEFGTQTDCLHIGKQNYPAANNEIVVPGGQTQAEEAAILDALQHHDVDLVALMGYMKRVGPRLVYEFGWRPEYGSPYQAMMLNTHPGLLPETKGMYGIHVQEHILAQHLPYTGQTLHVVAEDYDDGPTVAEHRVAVEAEDTPDSLFARVQQAEKQYIAQDIAAFMKQRAAYLMTV